MCHAEQADSERASLQRLLEYYDQHYDASHQMLEVDFSGPGYHSNIAQGTSVHPTRESLYYAVALFQRGKPSDISRAKAIVEQVLSLQQIDATREAYGVWPWLKEEPLEKMGSIDLNWADFCGSAIAQILVAHNPLLDDPALEKQMIAALGHAAKAIRKRDVGAGYTNIAVLGGGVCATAGEVLKDPAMLAYGRTRLENVVAFTEKIDGFAEYNSPPYGKVVIGECERILQLAGDERVRQAAETIRVAAWQMIADSFHPPTQQWAGPHSRHSHRRLTNTLVMFLNERTGLNIQPHPRGPSERPRGYGIVTPIPCPSNLLKKIQTPIRELRFLQRTFLLGRDGRPSIVGKTWLAPDACLGSVNRSSFWTQRQPVVGYWQTPNDPAVAFRVRFLHDGQSFSSMAVRAIQDQYRVLFVVHSLKDRGDWHRTLDRTPDGKFEAEDFRLRLELEGSKVSAVKRTGGRFALRAGDREVVIFPARSSFLGQPVVWKCSNKPNLAVVEGICYSGNAKKFDFSQLLDVQLAACLLYTSPSPRDKRQSRMPSSA